MWKLSTQALPSRQLVLSVRIREPNIQAKEDYLLDRGLYRPKNRSDLDDPDNYMPERFFCALY